MGLGSRIGASERPDERRLRIVARIVNQLRHSLTGPGVVDWFGHPRATSAAQPPRVSSTTQTSSSFS